MSFFGRLRPSAIQNAADAFVATIYASALADNDLSEAEEAAIAVQLRSQRHFPGTNLLDCVRRVPQYLDQYGTSDALLRACAPMLDETQRKAAYINALDLAFSDGDFEEVEQHFLERIARILEIPADFAVAALEMSRLKYGPMLSKSA